MQKRVTVLSGGSREPPQASEEGMHPVTEPCLGSLASSHSCSMTPTPCSEGSAPQQRLKTKWCVSPFGDRQAHSSAARAGWGPHPHTCRLDLAEAQVRDSCVSGGLSLASCLELRQESSPFHRALLFHPGGFASTQSRQQVSELG